MAADGRSYRRINRSSFAVGHNLVAAVINRDRGEFDDLYAASTGGLGGGAARADLLGIGSALLLYTYGRPSQRRRRPDSAKQAQIIQLIADTPEIADLVDPTYATPLLSRAAGGDGFVPEPYGSDGQVTRALVLGADVISIETASMRFMHGGWEQWYRYSVRPLRWPVGVNRAHD
jgi:hypothetical protein